MFFSCSFRVDQREQTGIGRFPFRFFTHPRFSAILEQSRPNSRSEPLPAESCKPEIQNPEFKIFQSPWETGRLGLGEQLLTFFNSYSTHSLLICKLKMLQCKTKIRIPDCFHVAFTRFRPHFTHPELVQRNNKCFPGAILTLCSYRRINPAVSIRQYSLTSADLINGVRFACSNKASFTASTLQNEVAYTPTLPISNYWRIEASHHPQT